MKAKRGPFFFSIVALVLSFTIILFSQSAHASRPRFIFLFIGDGMAATQIHSAEIYLASTVNPVPPGKPFHRKLAISEFPVQGLMTTFRNDSYITDSASAATAMATGRKTDSGIIAMDPARKTSFKSIARLAKELSMKVGIVTSVSLDHATPAAFYANQPSRRDYYEISMQMAKSDFDYFAGGFILHPSGIDGSLPGVLEAARANGFTIAEGRAAFDSLRRGRGGKVIAYNTAAALDDSKALYYALDRKHRTDLAGHITLAEYTRKGIELLQGSSGFLMVIEGGKIDWAAHANDARAVIDEVIALDEAIQEAVNFYAKHPSETLIVVTGDHETGGMTIGWAGSRYKTNFEILKNQTKSYDQFSKVVLEYFKTIPDGWIPADIDEKMKNAIRDASGLQFDALEPLEKEQLEQAFDRSKARSLRPADEKEYLAYGGYEPLAMILIRILNHRAGVGWTSYSHTGAPVPVFALGSESRLFHGFYDNTEIAKKLAAAMGSQLD